MVSKSHQRELLVRKFAHEMLLELCVVTPAHFLSPQILIDLEWVSRIQPVGQEIGTVVVSPGEMIHCKVGKDENRSPLLFLRDYTYRMIIKEAVGVGGACAQLPGVEEMLDAGGGLEGAGACKSSEPGIEAVSAVAALSQSVG